MASTTSMDTTHIIACVHDTDEEHLTTTRINMTVRKLCCQQASSLLSSTTRALSLVFVILFEMIIADASLVQVLLFNSASSLLACLCCSINRRRCPAPSVVFPLDSTAVSMFVDILVELLNTVFVNSANISTNIVFLLNCHLNLSFFFPHYILLNDDFF